MGEGLLNAVASTIVVSQPVRKRALMTTALITGASGGIGEALARALAVAHHDLVLVARNEGTLRALGDELAAAHGITTTVFAADLATANAAGELTTRLGDRPIDILVNNAGVGDYGPFHESDPAKVSQMVQLNVAALTDLTRALLPAMVARGSGRVLNVASTAAFMPGPLMAVYYATKAYVLSFSEAIADELKGTGVTVTALCPGPVATGFQQGADMGASKLLKGKQLMTADECARLALAGMNKGKPVVITGTMNKLQAMSPRFLPRRMVPGIVRKAQAPTH
jgi:short-subunit dehydrogenase